MYPDVHHTRVALCLTDGIGYPAATFRVLDPAEEVLHISFVAVNLLALEIAIVFYAESAAPENAMAQKMVNNLFISLLH